VRGKEGKREALRGGPHILREKILRSEKQARHRQTPRGEKSEQAQHKQQRGGRGQKGTADTT